MRRIGLIVGPVAVARETPLRRRNFSVPSDINIIFQWARAK